MALFSHLDAQPIDYEAPERIKVAPGPGGGKLLFGRELGRGSHATVKEALFLPSGRRIPVRVAVKAFGREPEAEAAAGREASHLGVLGGHSHVCALMETWRTHKIMIMLTYAGGGSVQALLVRHEQGLEGRQARRLVREAAQALEHVHAHRIVHRDVKPDNLLLTSSGSLLLADFSVAVALPAATSAPPLGEGALAYQAPECVASGAWLQAAPDVVVKADVWALGLVAAQLGTGVFPLATGSLLGLVEAIAKADYHMPATTPSRLRHLVEATLQVSPLHRPSAKELLLHEWFKEEEGGKINGSSSSTLSSDKLDLRPLPSLFPGGPDEWAGEWATHLVADLQGLDGKEDPQHKMKVEEEQEEEGKEDEESPSSGSFGDDDEDVEEQEEGGEVGKDVGPHVKAHRGASHKRTPSSSSSSPSSPTTKPEPHSGRTRTHSPRTCCALQ